MNRAAAPTINDVARLAGVSKKTVSRVINRSPLLNQGTRERVEKVIADLGYVPNPQARALALRHNFLIGLTHDNPDPHIVLSAQQGMLEVLRETEFELLVHPVDRASPDMVEGVWQFIERQRPYGVLLLPPLSDDDTLAALCRAQNVRYVRLGAAMLDEPAHMVASNDREAACRAVTQLLDLGHRRIAHVLGAPGFRSALERRLGYEDALAAAGIARQDQWFAQGDYSFESGVRAAEQLLALAPHPTAIFCSNDTMAAGVLHLAQRRGLKIPDDLSVIGFGDTPLAAQVWPPLTTVHWPVCQMAHAAARKLINDGAADQAEHLFPVTLVSRSTVASPAG